MRALFLMCTRGRYAVRGVSDSLVQAELIRYCANQLHATL